MVNMLHLGFSNWWL